MPYQAFISYSHAADGKLAPTLQSGLQKIAKPFYRLRAMRVFRDETNLQVTPKLWPAIQKAIKESGNFILMASPAAAASEWVQAEIGEWLRNDPGLNNFSIVLTEGEVVWDKEAGDFDWEKTAALPPILRGKFEAEPLYLDLRWARESEHLSLRDPRFLNSVGKLAAAIRGEELDAIIGEDVQQHRLFKRVAGAVIVLLLVLAAATSYAAIIANRQTRIAREQQAKAETQTIKANDALRDAYIENGRQELNNNYPFRAAVYLNAAYQMPAATEKNDRISNLLFLLGKSIKGVDSLEAVLKHDDNVQSAVFSPDGLKVVTASDDKTAKVWDAATGSLLFVLQHTDKVF